MRNAPEIYFKTLVLSLAARGAIALWLAIPVGLLIVALAWRIAVG
jgi:hypothetical protein